MILRAFLLSEDPERDRPRSPRIGNYQMSGSEKKDSQIALPMQEPLLRTALEKRVPHRSAHGFWKQPRDPSLDVVSSDVVERMEQLASELFLQCSSFFPLENSLSASKSFFAAQRRGDGCPRNGPAPRAPDVVSDALVTMLLRWRMWL